ncbi:MAG TPA: hypothetical protein ENH82_10280, partial [bacterium]|nr:hypothetical protein [bacterium]
SKCTSLKLLPGYENFVAHPDSFPAVADTVGTKIYTLKGKPSLDNIKIIGFGIKSNKSDNLLNCDIWVDELRMDSLRNMTGTAARVNFYTELSDFLNLNVKASQKSSDFHDMNAKKGTGKDNNEWNSQLAVNIEKFAPRRWNLRLPVNMSISDNKSLPRLKSGSDIILSPGQKSEYQSRSSSRKFRFSYSKNRDNSKKGLSGAFINWTFDKIDSSFDWGEMDSESPSLGKSTTDNMQVKTKYDAGMKKRSVKLFNWLPVLPFDLWENIADSDFSYAPSQLTYDYTYNKRNQYKTNIDGVSDSTRTLTSLENLNFVYRPFKAVNYTFTQRKKNDLYIKQEVSFVEMNHIKIEGPKIFNLTNNYDYTVKYDEADNPRYSLSSQLGSKSVKLDKSFSANASFAWNDLIENYSGKPKPPKPPSKRKSRAKKNWENTEKKDGIEKEPVKNDKKPGIPDILPEQRNKKPGMPDSQPEPGDKKTDKKDIPPDELKLITKFLKKLDQKKEPEKVSPEKKKHGPSIRTKFMMKISDIVNPITFNFTTREVFQYSGIEDRPDFMVRFGRGAVEPPDSITVVSRNNITTQRESYSANTNFKMPYNIDIRTSGKFSQDEKLSLSSSNRSEDITFPEVNFRWGNVENKISVLKRFLSRLSLNSTYSLSNSKKWQNESVRPISDIITRKFSPLVGFSATIKKVDANFSLNTSTQEKYDMSGLTKSFTLTESKNTSTTLRYNLKGLPIFKKMKLKSDIKLNLTFSTQSRETKRRIGKEVLARIADDSSWSFRPSAEYWFSQKFRGGASMEFKNSNDLRNKTRKVREVSIWGQIQF